MHTYNYYVDTYQLLLAYILSTVSMAVLKITVGHLPFPNQIQHLANQNLFWSAKFTAHFQWGGNQ